jgi:hypothetical protein
MSEYSIFIDGYQSYAKFLQIIVCPLHIKKQILGVDDVSSSWQSKWQWQSSVLVEGGGGSPCHPYKSGWVDHYRPAPNGCQGSPLVHPSLWNDPLPTCHWWHWVQNDHHKKVCTILCPLVLNSIQSNQCGSLHIFTPTVPFCSSNLWSCHEMKRDLTMELPRHPARRVCASKRGKLKFISINVTLAWLAHYSWDFSVILWHNNLSVSLNLGTLCKNFTLKNSHFLWGVPPVMLLW